MKPLAQITSRDWSMRLDYGDGIGLGEVVESLDGGTLCRDRVTYAVPGGWLADFLLVRRDVERIFAYRRAAIAEAFGVRPLSGDGRHHLGTSQRRVRER